MRTRSVPGAVRKLRLFLESVGGKRGQAKGEAKGRAEGKAEGEADGLVKGKREALLSVLAERGLVVTDEERTRVEECGDAERLGVWIRRAITASSVAEVLASAPDRETHGGARRARTKGRRAVSR